MKRNSSPLRFAALAIAALVLASHSIHAQVLISTLGGGVYVQNFDSLSNSPVGAVVPWADNSTLTGWYAARQVGGAFTNYTVDVGANNAGRLYSYGLNPAPDRALGLLGLGTPRTTAMGVRFLNDTTITLSNLTVSYTGEQWRNANGTNAVTNVLTFWYRSTNSPITSPDPSTNFSWTAVPELFFQSPVVTSTTNAGVALNGNAADNRQVFVSIPVVNFALSPGEELFLRWLKKDDAGSDAGLALDDLMVSFAAAQQPAAVVVSANTIQNNANTIGVLFSSQVDPVTATNPANYHVNVKSGPVGVTQARLRSDGKSVALTLAANILEFFSVSVSNVLDLANNSVSGDVIGYISDYSSTDVGTAADPVLPGQVYTAAGDTFDVTVGGSGIGGLQDHFHFIYQPVIGDFDTTVLVPRLDFANSLSQAGLMARETLAPESASLQTYLTPVTGANVIQTTVRPVLAGDTLDITTAPPGFASQNRWLRLTRSNEVFTSYYGTNGLDWTVSSTSPQTFGSTLLVGMAVSAHDDLGATTTATFTDFGKRGVRPGDGIQPTLSVSVNPTNISLTWERTPRDFAVQISTNLTDWSLLLAPIFEGNSGVPGNRSMEVPRALSSKPLFFRLTQVDRVIPDPPLALTTGLILSLVDGNVTTIAGNSLCSATVTNSITQTSMTAVSGYTVSFSTVDSGSTLNTVLQTRKVLVTSCDDDSAGNFKSQYLYTTPLPHNTTNTYSLVAAVKTNTPTTPTLLIKVKVLIY